MHRRNICSLRCFVAQTRAVVSKSEDVPGQEVAPLLVFGQSSFDALMGRIGVGGRGTKQVIRRATFLFAVTWLPLALTSTIQGEQGLQVNFLQDFSTHVRFLLAQCFLIATEGYVDDRIKEVPSIFVDRGMIRASRAGSFAEAVARAGSQARSRLGEILILIVAIAVGASQRIIDLPEWVTTWKAHGLAGVWYSFVSLSIFNFILLRWLWRYAVWCRFLIIVSRNDLTLQSHHPDNVGGLAFLLPRHVAFGVISTALSMVAAANIAELVLYGGQSLLGANIHLIAYPVVQATLHIAPLLVFTPLLVRTKRAGMTMYGTFSARHAVDFERRWSNVTVQKGPSPLGDPVISANNDLDGSYVHLCQMRLVLLKQPYLVGLGAFILAPLLPLVLLEVPLDEALKSLFELFI
jgi:hypothetical protein